MTRQADDRVGWYLRELLLVALLAHDHNAYVRRRAKELRRSLRKQDIVSHDLIRKVLVAKEPARLVAEVYKEYQRAC